MNFVVLSALAAALGPAPLHTELIAPTSATITGNPSSWSINPSQKARFHFTAILLLRDGFSYPEIAFDKEKLAA